MGFWCVFSGWCHLVRVQFRCFGTTVIFVFFSCIFVLLSISSEFFSKMINMSKFQLACAVVFYAVFQVLSVWAAVIVSFCQYRDPCTFSCHLSGFRGILSISGLFSLFAVSGVQLMSEVYLAYLWDFLGEFWDLLFFPSFISFGDSSIC